MRGVTVDSNGALVTSTISTHTPHARRDLTAEEMHRLHVISTHTPHARRDTDLEALRESYRHFYSHASCEA